jgi:sugar phosphate isomerase/epimerase
MKPLLDRLGIHADDLRATPKQAMEQAAALGFRHLQVNAAAGQLAPAQLDRSGRRHVQRTLSGLGVQLSALSADVTGRSAADSLTFEQHVHTAGRVLELAADLDVPVVSCAIGRVDSARPEQLSLLTEALQHIAAHADRVGRIYAIEAVFDTPQTLRDLLNDVACDQIKVCYDPGQLLRIGHDPLAPIEPLADDIALSHMRDAILGSPGQPGQETALGCGQLNIEAYLAHLEQAGYHGPQVLRRNGSASPELELAQAREWFRRLG